MFKLGKGIRVTLPILKRLIGRLFSRFIWIFSAVLVIRNFLFYFWLSHLEKVVGKEELDLAIAAVIHSHRGIGCWTHTSYHHPAVISKWYVKFLLQLYHFFLYFIGLSEFLISLVDCASDHIIKKMFISGHVLSYSKKNLPYICKNYPSISNSSLTKSKTLFINILIISSSIANCLAIWNYSKATAFLILLGWTSCRYLGLLCLLQMPTIAV